jgi:hypothetical protein
MYFVSPKGTVVEELSVIGKTKAGNPIVVNPGNGWTAFADPGERIRQDRDGNYIVSKRR